MAHQTTHYQQTFTAQVALNERGLKMSKSEKYILDTVAQHGKCYIGWSMTYGQRSKNAMEKLIAAGKIKIADRRFFEKSWRTSIIVVAV
jgi:uncharacterized protein YcaQ